MIKIEVIIKSGNKGVGVVISTDSDNPDKYEISLEEFIILGIKTAGEHALSLSKNGSVIEHVDIEKQLVESIRKKFEEL